MLLPPKTLDDWLAYISQTHPSEIELGLDRIKSVFNNISLKSKPSAVVMVGGTNGKGSTIAMIEASLASVGVKVGAYTSPHILNYNERVRILGQDVNDSQLINAFNVVDKARKETSLTYFEFGTLAALYLLFNADLDVVLLEVGLGGRLDAVNIVDADIAVITSVDFDHTDWLGSNLDQIGLEKAGILREKKVFIAGKDLPSCVCEKAEILDCQVYKFGTDFYEEKGSTVISLNSLKLRSVPSSSYLPLSNVLVSLQTSALVWSRLKEAEFTEQELSKFIHVIDDLKVPGRLEKVDKLPVFLDVAHNPQAARHLTKFLRTQSLKGLTIEVLFSALADKDIDSVASIVSPFVSKWHLAELDVERAVSLNDLSDLVGRHSTDIAIYDSIDNAIDRWLSLNSIEEDNKQKILVVFGSFFTVEAAKRFFKK